MESRANPSLRATKDFTIRVLPLTQQELDDAIKLMDAVGADYTQAILGDNTGSTAITTDLAYYNEAVFDDDGQLKHSRTVQDNTDRGVRIDDLPGSEPGGPGYEKWRTFRSGRPDIIDHEFLRLRKTPTYDATVTVTSCLTHDVLGKYAAKYPDNVTFRQLNEIEVMAVLTVKGTSSEPNPNPDATFQATFYLESKGYIEQISKTTLRGLKEGTMAFDVLKKVFADRGFSYTGGGHYISAVTDSKGKTLSEFDKGPNSGWMYHVNGTYTK